jgi:hypothetical protein
MTRKLPFGQVSYQVWYMYNPDNEAERWRSFNCNTLEQAYHLVENLTRGDFGDKLRSMQIYIIEFKGKIIGEQTNEYPV